MKRENPTNSTSGGYTMIELLFYVALFAILTFTVINSMLTMTKAFKETALQSELLAGSSIMERIVREARGAYDIIAISANDLKLNTTDEAGGDKTVEFMLSGSDVQFLENNILTGNLNTPNLPVTGLTFTQITSTNSKAIKVILTVRSNNDSLGRSVDFYDTIVLRGAY